MIIIECLFLATLSLYNGYIGHTQNKKFNFWLSGFNAACLLCIILYNLNI